MKIRIHLLAFALLFSTLTASLQASAKNSEAVTTSAAATDQNVIRATAIKSRLDEIKAMNLSELNSSQRKELRHEIKGMNKELRAMGPTYIYISGAALILIIILLIILL